MTDFGQALREAREAKGITVGQLAETTKILPAVIEGLENDDFSRIAAPIYGRGFVKLYCEAVGLDAKPFITEFMEIVNGNRETVIRERKTDADAATEAPAAVPAAPVETSGPTEPLPPVATVEQPEPPVKEPPLQKPVDEAPLSFEQAVEGDLFSEPPVSAPPDLFRRETQPLPDLPSAPEESPLPRQTISRYASPFRLKSRPAIPPAFWRMSVLAAAGLLVLALVFWGLRALYRATSNADRTPADAIEQTETAVRQGEEAPRSDAVPSETVSQTAEPVKRTPQKMPSLYID